MRITAVIPSRRWRNRVNGRTVSICGALPAYGAAMKDWHVETSGFTWQLSNGTVGLGRKPAATREEALRVMKEYNANRDGYHVITRGAN